MTPAEIQSQINASIGPYGVILRDVPCPSAYCVVSSYYSSVDNESVAVPSVCSQSQTNDFTYTCDGVLNYVGTVKSQGWWGYYYYFPIYSIDTNAFLAKIRQSGYSYEAIMQDGVEVNRKYSLYLIDRYPDGFNVDGNRIYSSGSPRSPDVVALQQRTGTLPSYVYTSPGGAYLYVGPTKTYDHYQSFWNDFKFSEFISAVGGNEAYYVTFGAGDPPASASWRCSPPEVDIDYYYIRPYCESSSSWRFRLNIFSYNNYNSYVENAYWELYGRHSFTGMSPVLLKEGYLNGSFSKSDFETPAGVVESGGETWDSWLYFIVRAVYLGKNYDFKVYGSHPPCSKNIFDGVGNLHIGSGLKSKGQGGKHSGMGGYEKNRNY